MTKHLITYDLGSPGRDYSGLYSAIKTYGDYKQICESGWAIKSTVSNKQIRNHLANYIDRNDKLFISTIPDDWAAQYLPIDVVSWLNS